MDQQRYAGRPQQLRHLVRALGRVVRDSDVQRIALLHRTHGLVERGRGIGSGVVDVHSRA